MTQGEKGGIFGHDVVVLIVPKRAWYSLEFPSDSKFTEEEKWEAIRRLLNGGLAVISQPSGAGDRSLA